MVEFEFLRERQNKTIVKELNVASAAAPDTFCFKSS